MSILELFGCAGEGYIFSRCLIPQGYSRIAGIACVLDFHVLY